MNLLKYVKKMHEGRLKKKLHLQLQLLLSSLVCVLLRSNPLRRLPGPSERHRGWRHAFHPEQSDRLHHYPPRPQRVPQQRRHHLQLGLWGREWSPHFQRVDRHSYIHYLRLVQASGGDPGGHPRQGLRPTSWSPDQSSWSTCWSGNHR